MLKPASPPPPGSTPPSAPPPERRVGIPVPIVVGAVIAGLVAVAVTSLFLPNKSGGPATPPASATGSTPAAADTGLDVKWRSGRMERGDCVGTFEVTRGSGTHAQFVAFVMDTTGAIIARDSGSVASARPGVLIDFRFRRVACERVYDWQLQVTTPKVRAP